MKNLVLWLFLFLVIGGSLIIDDSDVVSSASVMYYNDTTFKQTSELNRVRENPIIDLDFLDESIDVINSRLTIYFDKNFQKYILSKSLNNIKSISFASQGDISNDNIENIDDIKDNNFIALDTTVSLSNRGHSISSNLYMPEKFTWSEPNMEKLHEYLEKRNSEFIYNDRLEVLNKVGKEYDISVYFLLAITGAEQSFVPRSSSSHLIIKNPFNVYHSWKEYGKSLEDSTEVASQTILNLMRGYSRNYGDPYRYLNRRYAEDKNWHNNVRNLHNELLNYCK